VLHLSQGELASAIVDCSQASRLAPDNSRILSLRGVAHLLAGRIPDALSDQNAALALDPKDPVALYGRGTAKTAAGDVAGGQADVAAAERVLPDIADLMAEFGVRRRER
jgi:Flp pilus assembly protein TadD